MGEHRRLRRAGGAAREEQRGQVVVGTVGDRSGVGREEVFERAGIVERMTRGRDHVLHRRHVRAVDVSPARAAGRADDHGDGLDRGELALELGCGAQRVEGDDDAADAEHGQVRDDEGRVVRAQESDPIVRAEPERRQAAPERRDLLTEGAVGRRRVPVTRARRRRRDAAR